MCICLLPPQHRILLARIRINFMLWEQFIGPSLKAMRTLVLRPLQGYGNTVSLSYPDTWVRKQDCLHLPYVMEVPEEDLLEKLHRETPPSIYFLSCRNSLGPFSGCLFAGCMNTIAKASVPQWLPASMPQFFSNRHACAN